MSHHEETFPQNRLLLAIGLSAAILVGELVGGFVSNSLALLSDAGHVFTDVIALSLSWFGVRQALRPATSRMTFGYHRVGILIALFNAALIALIAIIILYESYQRLRQPQEVQSLLMLGVAAAGLAANLVVVFWLRGVARHSLNIRSAFFHAGGDALASVGVIAGGLIIYFTGWFWVDPLVSVILALIIVAAAWGIVREAINVLVEGSPIHINVDDLVKTLKTLPGVLNVHDLHIWSLTPQLHALACHVQVNDSMLSQQGTLLGNLRELLNKRYNICHTTIQLECAACESQALYCQIGPGPAHGDSEESERTEDKK